MNIIELELKLQNLTQKVNQDEFIFDFLNAFKLPKSTISRLKKNSDVNTLNINGELTVKNKKFFFKRLEKLENVDFEELIKNKKSMRFIFVTNFKTIKAYDTKLMTSLEIDFEELSKNSDFFWPIAGVEKTTIYEEKEADVKASIKMAKLFEEIKKSNPMDSDEQKHNLNLFLTRILFCYFAEDTGIFPIQNQFTNYIKSISDEDGGDLHTHLDTLFDTLNSKNRDISNHLKEFPYVNGGLFKDKYPPLNFTNLSRKLLIECGAELNWSLINPDIFGSMIQAVISDEHRGTNGMHYTSVPNIMKVINPLFLDELKETYEKAKTNEKKLLKLHQRITNLKIFDPACGSGNFLIIAYKELRKLEMKIFKSLHVLNMPSVELSQFYGIELDDFAHEVAILSLWLAQHQMNQEFTKAFGNCTPTLPLTNSGNIVCGNATRLDWEEVCPKNEGDEIYILGNPPYLGSRNQKLPQKEDMKYLFTKDYKSLDYIACWFYKGAYFIRNFNAKLAFVSTNSISQGEQVALIWPRVLKDDLEICFAHKSFKWSNNAKANAAVIVVIIGLSNTNTKTKSIYKDDLKIEVSNITPYLIRGKTIYVHSRGKPLSLLPNINFGNMPADGGKLLFTTEEKEDFIEKEPLSEKWFKQLLSAQEFINGKKRWCLWLEDIKKEELEKLPLVKQKVDELRIIRQNSSRPHLADIPHLFAQITQPKDKDFVLIPSVSSENRKYIPMDIFDKNYKSSNSCFIVITNNLYVLGVLTSYMHMVWMKEIGGKLKSDYRYSKNVVYNTFPFPKITLSQKEKIEELVNIILDERDKEYLKTLAELYDPNKMPDGLKQAHENLDFYIESIYRDKPFCSDEERLEYLFKLYEKMIKEENQK